MTPLRRQPEWDRVPDVRVRRADVLGLAPFHLRVLNAISHGLTEDEAAVVLGVTLESTHQHMTEARRALRGKNAAHTVARAIRYGLIA